jgi:putative ABC transport system substrate-binding protein
MSTRSGFDVLFASTEGEIDTAFTDIVRQKTDVLIIATDPFLLGQRDQVVGLAARYAVPTMYFLREFWCKAGLKRGRRISAVFAAFYGVVP